MFIISFICKELTFFPCLQTLQLGCACHHSTCYPETCDHVYLFDNDYADAKDIYGRAMRGRFPYDQKGRIIIEVVFTVVFMASF